MMIYLLAILWFASGFSIGLVGGILEGKGEDIVLFSKDSDYIWFATVIGPATAILFILNLYEINEAPKITLFKAHNK